MIDLSYFDNLHKGQRGFVIGGGPSINKINSNVIDILNKEEILIGANRAYEKFNVNYMCFIDPKFYQGYYKKFGKLDCTKFAHLNLPVSYRKEIKNFYKFERDRNHKNILPNGFTYPISLRNNTGCLCLRIAYLLGLNPIYLVGVDLDTSDLWKGTPNFHSGYERLPKEESFQKFAGAFVPLINELNRQGVSVYSCSPNSILNRKIQYVDLNTFFL